MKALKEYNSIREKIRTLRETATIAAKVVISSELETIFEEYPQLDTISWTQYTPYFNDGDVCEFGCGAGEPDINGEDYWYLERGSTLKEAAKKAGAILGSIENEDYLALFGDHAEVIVYRDGRIEVQSYSHE